MKKRSIVEKDGISLSLLHVQFPPFSGRSTKPQTSINCWKSLASDVENKFLDLSHLLRVMLKSPPITPLFPHLWKQANISSQREARSTMLPLQYTPVKNQSESVIDLLNKHDAVISPRSISLQSITFLFHITKMPPALPLAGLETQPIEFTFHRLLMIFSVTS